MAMTNPVLIQIPRRPDRARNSQGTTGKPSDRNSIKYDRASSITRRIQKPATLSQTPCQHARHMNGLAPGAVMDLVPA